MSPFAVACALGALPAVAALLAHVKRHNRAGLAAFASCSGSGSFADVPLVLAAAGGHTEIVRALLAAGADPLARDSRGCWALWQAAWAGPKGSGAAKLLLAALEARAGQDPLAVKLHLQEPGHEGNSQTVMEVCQDPERCGGWMMKRLAGLNANLHATHTQMGWTLTQAMHVRSLFLGYKPAQALWPQPQKECVHGLLWQ
jgi:ankyrin repeat protein